MKQTRIIMGMPITVEVVGGNVRHDIESVFEYFVEVDQRYSTYKPDSEITRINNGLAEDKWSEEMRQVLSLCEETKERTNGYFDVMHDGRLDPSGLVKGWAINNAAALLRDRDIENFYIEAGGDIQVDGTNSAGEPWAVGIRNPFKLEEIIKVLSLTTEGVATSGTYIRGQHIYNPLAQDGAINDVKSMTVIGPNIYEADRFATAAFAMGDKGISFIDSMPYLEGYMVDQNQRAIYTRGFEKYVMQYA